MLVFVIFTLHTYLFYTLMYCVCPLVKNQVTKAKLLNILESLFALGKPVINIYAYSILISQNLNTPTYLFFFQDFNERKTHNSRFFLFHTFMTNSPSIENRRIYMYKVGKPNQGVTNFRNIYKSRKENPQKPTQLSSRSHPRHLVGIRTAQKTPS